jgi:hypothetical protein
MHVKDKVCVVTGAASGIGAAVARAYAQAGARGVVVADLKSSRDRLAGVAGEIDGLAVTADVGQEADIQSLIAAAEARFGPVDVFFSNAGLSRKGQETAVRCRLGRELAGACHEPRFRGARAGARHARARIRLPAQYRLRRGPAGVAEFHAVRRHQTCRGGAGGASRHSIWRPRHPRFRALSAVGADRHDDRGSKCGAGRRRDAAG